MEKHLEVQHLESDYPKQITSRKLSVEDQEYKWGDERHREERGNEETREEPAEEEEVAD